MGPLGHTLSGVTVYLGICTVTRRKPTIGETAVAAVFANAPDLDLISAIWAGFDHANKLHHSYSHTLGFALFCGLIAMLIHRKRPLFAFSLVALSVIAHNTGDFFTRDTSYPNGLMMLWPFYPDYMIGPSLFLDIHKASWMNLISAPNIKATIHEFLAFTPLMSILSFILLVQRRTLSGASHEPR